MFASGMMHVIKLALRNTDCISNGKRVSTFPNRSDFYMFSSANKKGSCTEIDKCSTHSIKPGKLYTNYFLGSAYIYDIRKSPVHGFSTTACFLKKKGAKKKCEKNAINLKQETASDEEMAEEEDDELIFEDEEYRTFVRQFFHILDLGHRVFVIQPYIKWGPEKKKNTTPELQLAEAVALVETLPKWKVVEKMILSLKNFNKQAIFGSGNLEMLTEKIHSNSQITAVFISINMLRGIQQRALEDLFRVTVYDRYTLVLQIFKEHARTKEARLQVALAEVPYLRTQLKDFHEGKSERGGGRTSGVGGSGETFMELKKRLLFSREHKIKEAIKKLQMRREILRVKRRKHEFPVVAVVGYTNSGKTSLIKALTGEASLQPRNQLFATLDVTAHAGVLPCGLEVLYMDTVGFISDIPTTLIESFAATLEDALNADVIVHVRDISHPDTAAQCENVLQTLQGLQISKTLIENIVTAGNKMDLLGDGDKPDTEDMMLVSATKEIGTVPLCEKIQEAVLISTGRMVKVFRVLMGGPEYSWMYREAAVVDQCPDADDQQYMLMEVIMTQRTYAKYKHRFGTAETAMG